MGIGEKWHLVFFTLSNDYHTIHVNGIEDSSHLINRSLHINQMLSEGEAVVEGQEVRSQSHLVCSILVAFPKPSATRQSRSFGHTDQLKSEISLNAQVVSSLWWRACGMCKSSRYLKGVTETLAGAGCAPLPF